MTARPPSNWPAQTRRAQVAMTRPPKFGRPAFSLAGLGVGDAGGEDAGAVGVGAGVGLLVAPGVDAAGSGAGEGVRLWPGGRWLTADTGRADGEDGEPVAPCWRLCVRARAEEAGCDAPRPGTVVRPVPFPPNVLTAASPTATAAPIPATAAVRSTARLRRRFGPGRRGRDSSWPAGPPGPVPGLEVAAAAPRRAAPQAGRPWPAAPRPAASRSAVPVFAIPSPAVPRIGDP